MAYPSYLYGGQHPYGGYFPNPAYFPRESQIPAGMQQTPAQSVVPATAGPATANGLTGNYTCRPVMSKEEAVAIQAEFFSPGVIMPDLGHGKIYLKRINPDTAAAEFYEFSAMTDQRQATATETPVYVTEAQLQEVWQEIERLKKPTGKAAKKNDTDE